MALKHQLTKALICNILGNELLFLGNKLNIFGKKYPKPHFRLKNLRNMRKYPGSFLEKKTNLTDTSVFKIFRLLN